MSSNNKSWKLSNLYIPKYTKDLKFTELTDLASIHYKNQPEDEKYGESDVVPSGICDPVKNSHPYKKLISALNIVVYNNIDALTMIKEKLESDSIEDEVNSDLLEEITNLNNERRDSHSSDLLQEIDAIFLWRSTKLSIKSIAIKLGVSIYFVRNTIKKYKSAVRNVLLANRINSNKERRVINSDQISQIKTYWKTNSSKPFYISDVVREAWPKSNGRIPPANSTISRVLKKTLRMSYRVLRPAPEKILKPEYIRSYWEAVLIQWILDDRHYELIYIDEFSISHRDTKMYGWSF